MKLLIIPILPIAVLYFSHAMAHLPLPLPVILVLTGAIIFFIAVLLLLRLVRSTFYSTPPTYLYGLDFGRGTSKAPTAREYCRPPKGPREYLD